MQQVPNNEQCETTHIKWFHWLYYNKIKDREYIYYLIIKYGVTKLSYTNMTYKRIICKYVYLFIY